MEKLKIVCVDDQRDVLAALRKDLEPLAGGVSVVACESAAEASEVLDLMDRHAEEPALLVCDHVMPGTSGIDFLIATRKEGRFPRTRRVLLTGLATHHDTIEAINKAHIDQYIEKPWNGPELVRTVRSLLTRYVLDAGIDYKPYLGILDQETLYGELRKKSVL
jgi:two-component system, chemotaxis family, chemotaxis protein CheY